jgi:SNF2 family DNA or RNA helicase
MHNATHDLLLVQWYYVARLAAVHPAFVSCLEGWNELVLERTENGSENPGQRVSPLPKDYWMTKLIENPDMTFFDKVMKITILAQLEYSCKWRELLRIIDSAEPRQDGSPAGILIGSQFAAVVTPFYKGLRKRYGKEKVLRLQSGLSAPCREAIIKKFQSEDNGYHILIANLGTCNTGITLTRANVAVMLEPHTSPTMEIQFSHRPIRVTQKEPYVRVYRLCNTASALEWRIYEICAARNKFSDSTYSSSAAGEKGEGKVNPDWVTMTIKPGGKLVMTNEEINEMLAK